jgi:DNA repair protein RecN (Recombination protein N)
MIEALRIENLAIVAEAELEFGPGLNVLTGETGAGKSMVLGALSMLVGGRAALGSLREGEEQGAVEAIFQTEAIAELERELERRGLGEGDTKADTKSNTEADTEETSHELVVRRSITKSGRSRARVGGQLVPISTLGELFAGRIEISSQHSSQALLRPESHGRLLDAAGGLLPLREEVRAGYEAVRALDAELTELREAAEERARRQDFLAFQLAEIDEVGLESGEIEELARDHARLAHAESLRADGSAAVAALSGDDSFSGESAVDLIQGALRRVEAMARLDSGLAELLERIRGLDTELRDVAADVERYADGVEGDPARLAGLDERIAEIEKLRRKYGQTEQEILAQRDGISSELDAIEGADHRIDEIERERARSQETLAETARELSAGRAKAGRKLAREVQRSLRELAMPDARFEVALEPAANLASLPEGVVSGPSGAEAPEFRFSANKGEAPRSLQKVASGGELSRVFLAVKNALRKSSANMVLVFDEVDAGIGGRAAERVGRVLAELASQHQVLCITHLPQIAAFADTHFRVQKAERKGRTHVEIERIEGDARVDEIARMAGGEEITAATRRHARDLMKVKTRI